MAKRIIWINETKKRINEFTIGYMINPGFNVNKKSKSKWKHVRIQHLVKSHNLLLKPHYQKTITSVLALIMFYETKGDNLKKLLGF